MLYWKNTFRNNHRLMVWALGLLLLLAGGCAVKTLAVKVKTETAPGVNLHQYKTYNWFQEVPVAAPQETDKYNNTFDQHVRRAIESELNKRGFRKTDQQPEILIAYDVVLHGKGSPDYSYAPGFGYGYAFLRGYRYNYDTSRIPNYKPVEQYSSGSFLIDVIKADDNTLVWRGWNDAIINNMNAGYDLIENYVDDILDKYPGAKTD